MKRYTMIALTNAKPGREAEMLAWYNDIHLGQVLDVPGVVSAQLSIAADIPAAGAPQWRYAGVYGIEGDDAASVFDEMMRRYVAQEMTPSDAMDSISYNGIFEDGPVLSRATASATKDAQL